MKFHLLAALVLLGPVAPALAQTNAAPVSSNPASSATTGGKAHQATIAEMQATIDQLTQSNHDLLDLLKQQQSVLQDIQFDRRQQGRHIESLEVRLEEAMEQNSKLQTKLDKLEAEDSVRPAVTAPEPVPTATNAAPAITNVVEGTDGTTPEPSPTLPSTGTTNAPAAEPAPHPASFLPPEDTVGQNGKTWHRLLVLKGTDGKQTDLFQIRGRVWRVLWHNEDPDDKKLKNTAGLFIDAFPKDDTIPQHVCAKVGSGGDSTDLVGPGNYFLKITAAGGSWELAVEDLQ
jgi:hypothetical protein